MYYYWYTRIFFLLFVPLATDKWWKYFKRVYICTPIIRRFLQSILWFQFFNWLNAHCYQFITVSHSPPPFSDKYNIFLAVNYFILKKQPDAPSRFDWKRWNILLRNLVIKIVLIINSWKMSRIRFISQDLDPYKYLTDPEHSAIICSSKLFNAWWNIVGGGLLSFC